MLTGPSRGRIAHAGALEVGIPEQPGNLRDLERAFRRTLRMGCEVARLLQESGRGSRCRDIALVTRHFPAIIFRAGWHPASFHLR
jgi:hypothetical protein